MTVAGGADLTYDEALRALAARGRFGIRLGLGRTRALLRELGRPAAGGPRRAGRRDQRQGQRARPRRLGAAGGRAIASATTPKPHLVTYRERIWIDGRPIAADDFARLVERVLGAADRIARRHGEPTEFELLTAVVFARFAEVRPRPRAGRGRARRAARCDPRLGRRRGRRHQRRPRPHGPARRHDRRRSPARRRRSSSAATWPSPAPTVTAWRSSAGARARLGVPLTEVEPAPLLGWDRDGHRRRAAAARADPGRAARTPPGGERRDRRCAARRARGGRASRRSRRRPAGPGYASARLAGPAGAARASGDRDVLLDGAHNPAGAAALAVALDDLRPFLGRRAAHARDGVDGGQGRRRRHRGPGDVDRARRRDRRRARASTSPRAMPAADLAARWRPAQSRARSRDRPGRAPTRLAALDARAGRSPGRSSSPVRSILSGRCAAQLVDDPDLRDPDPREAA